MAGHKANKIARVCVAEYMIAVNTGYCSQLATCLSSPKMAFKLPINIRYNVSGLPCSVGKWCTAQLNISSSQLNVARETLITSSGPLQCWTAEVHKVHNISSISLPLYLAYRIGKTNDVFLLRFLAVLVLEIAYSSVSTVWENTAVSSLPQKILDNCWRICHGMERTPDYWSFRQYWWDPR